MNAVTDVARATSALQSPERNWPLANCDVDLWIGLLHEWGEAPEAALAFTATMDFQGDQFTFYKFPRDDLERLYGIEVQELSLYDGLERHAVTQVGRGRVVVVEADGFYLPDTRATSYRVEHVKTNIGIESIDPDQQRLWYFHNAGRYMLEGEDYDGVLRLRPHLAGNQDILPPYAEIAWRRWPALRGSALLSASLDLLRKHVRRRPEANPVSQYRECFAAQMDMLLSRSPEFFHLYAFNTMRQFGSNFELLGNYLRWLTGQGVDGLDPLAEASDRMAASAKTLQFRVARIASRRRFDPCSELLDNLEADYDAVLWGLIQQFG